MDPIASPDAGPVHSSQILGKDSQESKKHRMSNSLAFLVHSPTAAASAKLFSAPENSAANSPARRLDTCSVSLQQADRTSLGSGIMKTTIAPPVNISTFSICFKQDLKAEGGGGANCKSPFRWYHPSSSGGWAGLLHQYLGRRNSKFRQV
jgi:hypothetical protein